MNFIKRYRCFSTSRHIKDDEDTSLVSDLGFDGAECNSDQAPTAEELEQELLLLVQRKASKGQISAALNVIQTWTMVVMCDIKQETAGRLFVRYHVVPTILRFVEDRVKQGDKDGLLVEQAVEILHLCTSFHDRRTSKQEKCSKDMVLQLVKHNGVKTLVAVLDCYCGDSSRKKRKSLFKLLWTTLLNIATCDKAISLLKLPKISFEEQERLLLDVIVKYTARAEAEIPAFWMERLFIALHFFLKFNGEPDMQTRMLMAEKNIVDELLRALVEGRRQFATKDPCVTALAMSFFLTCLGHNSSHDENQNTKGSKKWDALARSIDMDRLTRFTVRAMNAFPTSQIIQGSGCMVLNEIPPVYRILACHDSAVIVPSSCGAMADHEASGGPASAFASVVGTCWACRPSQR
jgi:hypothetical protein